MFAHGYVPLSRAPGLWGAYADYMYLDPCSIVHRVAKHLPASLAVMFNPLGAGFRWAVEIPNTGPGDVVLVLGPGQRGLASVIAARAAGADTIIVTGLARDAPKLALAREFGADHVINVDEEDTRTRVKELTNGHGADVVIYSATKHIDGQGRCLGGVVLCSEKFLKDHLHTFLRQTGPSLSPFNAWVMLKGLETLPLRVRAQCETAAKAAAHLKTSPRIKKFLKPFSICQSSQCQEPHVRRAG